MYLLRNVFVLLSCIVVIFLFSIFPQAYKLQAANATYENLNKVSLDENYTDAYMELDSQTDFKFPSRSIPSTNSKLKPWKGPKLVVIDPGHGGYDPGANKGNILEKNISLDVALNVEKILKGYKVPTYITRSDDRFVELKDRIQAANERNAALFVSIHCNWFKSPHLNGTMTLYYPSESLSAGYLIEKDYARLLQSELIKALGTKDMGIEDRSDLAVLRHAKMPTALVELGFLSNPKEAKLLSSEDFKQKAAEGIAEGIRKSLIRMSAKGNQIKNHK